MQGENLRSRNKNYETLKVSKVGIPNAINLVQYKVSCDKIKKVILL